MQRGQSIVPTAALEFIRRVVTGKKIFDTMGLSDKTEDGRERVVHMYEIKEIEE